MTTLEEAKKVLQENGLTVSAVKTVRAVKDSFRGRDGTIVEGLRIEGNHKPLFLSKNVAKSVISCMNEIKTFVE